MQSHMLLLRLSYWIPALADFFVAYRVLNPEMMGVEGFVYPMGLASAAIFSWGVMLLIADRKPVQRRWVLVPTILVVGLLTMVRLIASQYELIEFNPAWLLFGIGLVGLMTYGYISAGKKPA